MAKTFYTFSKIGFATQGKQNDTTPLLHASRFETLKNLPPKAKRVRENPHRELKKGKHPFPLRQIIKEGGEDLDSEGEGLVLANEGQWKPCTDLTVVVNGLALGWRKHTLDFIIGGEA